MKQEAVVQMTHQIMKKNQTLFNALASEKPVSIKKHKEEDIIDQLMGLIPKSTEGKILAAGAIGLLAYLYLKSK